jgi:putative transposase
MPRGLRVDGPGLLQHVTVRGVEQRDIFVDDLDRWDLVHRLNRLIPGLGFLCFAWVFMSNHVHLVLQTGPVGLAKLMHRLGTGYVLAFNRRHGRVGHLWQDRYWSRPLEQDLETVVSYVHGNPGRAGLVPDDAPHLYTWCGQSWQSGQRAAHAFELTGGRALAVVPQIALPVRAIPRTPADVAHMLGREAGDRASRHSRAAHPGRRRR